MLLLSCCLNESCRSHHFHLSMHFFISSLKHPILGILSVIYFDLPFCSLGYTRHRLIPTFQSRMTIFGLISLIALIQRSLSIIMCSRSNLNPFMSKCFNLQSYRIKFMNLWSSFLFEAVSLPTSIPEMECTIFFPFLLK